MEESLGIAQGAGNELGKAIVYDNKGINPSDVLWKAIQEDAGRRKQARKASQDALAKVNKMGVEGMLQDRNYLLGKKDTVLNKAQDYITKYGTDWSEYNPKNAQQAKEAMDIQRDMAELEYDSKLSQDFQTMYQQYNQKLNSSKMWRKRTAEKGNEFWSKDFDGRKKYIQEFGGIPDLEPQLDYRNQARIIGQNIGIALNQEEKGGRIITNAQPVEDAINNQTQNFMGTPEGIQWAEDLAEQGYQPKQITEIIKSGIADFVDTKYKNILSPVAQAQAKAQIRPKMEIGEEVPVTADVNVFSDISSQLGLPYPSGAGNKVIINKNVAAITGYRPIKYTSKEGKSLEIKIPTVNKKYEISQDSGGDVNFKEPKDNFSLSTFQPQGIINTDKGKLLIGINTTKQDVSTKDEATGTMVKTSQDVDKPYAVLITPQVAADLKQYSGIDVGGSQVAPSKKVKSDPLGLF